MVHRENGLRKRKTGFLVTLLRLPVFIYRAVLSPSLPRACRYEPSCSIYMLEALRLHGPVRGLYLGLRRLLRCHPWSRRAAHDPVPERCLHDVSTL